MSIKHRQLQALRERRSSVVGKGRLVMEPGYVYAPYIPVFRNAPPRVTPEVEARIAKLAKFVCAAMKR